ncbi:MAG: LuxR family transcriptional regulator, partial [Pseudonocardia sp.]|nr:LuxR family transcriptional regulator [Pseudonocardia sp.]
IKNGRVAEGLALLDEAMVSVLADELPPEMAGNIYCNVIAACHELADYRRMRQWTEATESWLTTMPVAVVFAGICRVHRAQLAQVSGDWERSEREAAQVCVDLAHMLNAAAAEGHYQVGEINRLRGDLAAAEAAYQRAHRLGRDPQPGLALLRVAQQRAAAALSSIQSALIVQPTNRLARARLLAAQVGIALAADDPAVARKGSAELDGIAEAFASPGLRAAAEHARGAVLLAEGHVAEAVPVLMGACRAWQEIGAPYECAQVRLLLCVAYRGLDDADSAELERAAAADAFAELGATPDAATIAAMRHPTARPGGLTEREVEVLACVAAGRSNKEIAATLVISDKTVQRHLANIFTKLDLGSRTAAAAYAFEHGLVPSSRG